MDVEGWTKLDSYISLKQVWRWTKSLLTFVKNFKPFILGNLKWQIDTSNWKDRRIHVVYIYIWVKTITCEHIVDPDFSRVVADSQCGSQVGDGYRHRRSQFFIAELDHRFTKIAGPYLNKINISYVVETETKYPSQHHCCDWHHLSCCTTKPTKFCLCWGFTALTTAKVMLSWSVTH